MALKKLIKGTTALMALAVVSFAAPAQAYPIDCAILLCLAGGWPASASCAAAKAEFIRRITPWPVEPPLQVWRCPMGASHEQPLWDVFRSRLLEASAHVEPWTDNRRLSAAAAGSVDGTAPSIAEQADIDISGPSFDFVRSIKVYHIRFYQRESGDGDCHRYDATRRGFYGVQGDFRWSGWSAYLLPAWAPQPHDDCSGGSIRAVAVEWRDHAGRSDHEIVRY